MSRTSTSVRVGLGALLSAAVVAGVVVSGVVPWPEASASAPSTEVTAAPAETRLACDGPLLAVGRVADDASALSSVVDTTVVAGNALGESPDGGELAITGADATAPLFVQLPDGREAVSVAAASSASADAVDMGGFAASACRAPQTESWLVGGDTMTGTTGVVLIANPTDVGAVVSIEVYGASGRTVPVGSDAVAIPAGTQVALPLAGLAGGEEGPVLRITATGAPVRASLQSSLVRTLDTGGVDVQPATSLATRQVVTGVTVTEEAAGSENPAGLVRLLSTSDTTATVTVVSSDGSAREPEQVQLVADEPLTFDLGGLEPGRYTVVVDAADPLVAAVWQTTGFSAGSDFAWYVPGAALSGATLFAVPEGPDPRLELYNAGDETVAYKVRGDDFVRKLEIDPGETISLPLAAGSGVYSLDVGEAEDVHAAVGLSGERALASLPIDEDAALPAALVVYP